MNTPWGVLWGCTERQSQSAGLWLNLCYRVYGSTWWRLNPILGYCNATLYPVRGKRRADSPGQDAILYSQAENTSGNVTFQNISAMTWKEARTWSLNAFSQLTLPQSLPAKVLGRSFDDMGIHGGTFWWALEQPCSLTWFSSPVTLFIPWSTRNFHHLVYCIIESKIMTQKPSAASLLQGRKFNEKVSSSGWFICQGLNSITSKKITQLQHKTNYLLYYNLILFVRSLQSFWNLYAL